MYKEKKNRMGKQKLLVRDEIEDNSINSADRQQLENIKGNFRRRQWHPTPVLLPGKSHGRWSLVGYSPWGC